jgi:hypothetical protein
MDPADTIKNTTLKLIVLCCKVADPDPQYVGDPDSDFPFFWAARPGTRIKVKLQLSRHNRRALDARNLDQQLSVGDKTTSFAEMISNYCTCMADLCQLCIELLALCFCSSQGPILSC